MHVERQFRVARERDEVVERLCDDKTLVELFPGETEIVDSEGDRRTVRTRYDLLGRDAVVTFHFTYLLDGNVRFEKVCDGRVWRELIGHVTVEEERGGAQVRIEMRGSTKALVPERAIKAPLEEHIDTMETLRQTIQLRTFAQRDPLVEYKQEAYAMFTDLMGRINGEICNGLFRSATSLKAFEQFLSSLPRHEVHKILGQFGGDAASEGGGATTATAGGGNGEQMDADSIIKAATYHRDQPKVGRNDPCPCGSGKKFKKCCLH